MTNILNFFDSEQKKHWDKATKNTQLFNEGKSYLYDNGIYKIYDEIRSITNNDRTFSRIKELPSLNSKFLNLYSENLDNQLSVVKEEIEIEKRRSEEYLQKLKDYGIDEITNSLRNNIEKDYANLVTKAESEGNIQKLKSYESEAKTLSSNHNKLIDKEIEKYNHENNTEEKSSEYETSQEIPMSVREVRSVERKLSQLSPNLVWKVSSEKDVDQYLSSLKESIINELKMNDGAVLEIEI